MVLQIDDKHRKRVEALRELMKGEGLGEENGEKAWYDAIGEGYSEKDFFEIMGLTEELLPAESMYLEAFSNALTWRDGKNLTRRREEYLAKNGSISARTLMRYEQEGVELFVKCFELAEEQFDRRKELEEDEDIARDIDIQVLRERVSKLEEGLDEKSESIHALTSKLEEMARVESSLQEAHSLLEAQGRNLTDAMQRISDLETMLYCYSEHVNQVFFSNGLTGVLSGKTYDDFPPAYAQAQGGVGFWARQRLSDDS